MTPSEVFKGLPNIPYYLSFDIDCLSPNVTADTGTPLIGGLTYYQALSLMDYASKNLDKVIVTSLDACTNLMDSMDDTQTSMVRLLQNLPWADDSKTSEDANQEETI